MVDSVHVQREAFAKKHGGWPSAIPAGQQRLDGSYGNEWYCFPTGALIEGVQYGACREPDEDPLKRYKRIEWYWSQVYAMRKTSHDRLLHQINATFLMRHELPPDQQHSLVRSYAGPLFAGDEDEAKQALHKSKTEFNFAKDALQKARKVLEELTAPARERQADYRLDVMDIQRKVEKTFAPFALGVNDLDLDDAELVCEEEA